MSSLTVFNFNSNSVRVISINNEPWFVAKDVASILEYANPTMMTNLVEDEDKQTTNPQKLDSLEMRESFGSSTFKLSIINESGLYACIFGSTKPEAKKFKKWVTSEVLPTLRQTGTYSVPPVSETVPTFNTCPELLLLQEFAAMYQIVANSTMPEDISSKVVNLRLDRFIREKTPTAKTNSVEITKTVIDTAPTKARTRLMTAHQVAKHMGYNIDEAFTTLKRDVEKYCRLHKVTGTKDLFKGMLWDANCPIVQAAVEDYIQRVWREGNAATGK